jgi:hypothetical protein
MTCDNRKPTSVQRLVLFALGALSGGCLLMAQALSAEGAYLMLRLKSPHGGDVMAVAMRFGTAGLISFLVAVVFLIVLHHKRWKQALRFPTPLTVVTLLPGVYVFVVLLPYYLLLRTSYQ